jgi:O-antigen/teichoic acid export membrane protein
MQTQVKTRKSDIAWSYIGTIFSSCAGFILLPLLLKYLTDSEIGLWYVFVAIAGLATLLQLGLTPAFTRNIVYCLSGVGTLSKSRKDGCSLSGEINWHLLKTVMLVSKIFYAVVGCIVFVLLVVPGSAYVDGIARNENIEGLSVAWTLFCFAVVLDIYFQYCDVFLKGFGDIASSNKSRTASKIIQLLSSGVMLFWGLGLIGACFGYLLGSVTFRCLSLLYARKQTEINFGIQSDPSKITIAEMREVLSTIFYIAWRDGIVMLALYAATQASALICSMFLTLGETGSYSILLQFGNTICSFAASYALSCYPEYQSAYIAEDTDRQREIVAKSTILYWLVLSVCVIGVITVIFPILPFFKPNVNVDCGLFLGVAFYLALLNHHSMYCSFIISMNEIPYVKNYIVASAGGILFTVFLLVAFDVGPWALVLGQGIPQLCSNNIKWPVFVMRRLGTTYPETIALGFKSLFCKKRRV